MDAVSTKKALEIFHQYDINKSNFIELKEYKNLLNDTCKKLNVVVPESSIDECFDSYDMNKDTLISKEEFIKAFEGLMEFQKEHSN